MYEIRYIKGSWQGIERGENKDRHLILEHEDETLFVVFDGVSSTSRANACIDIAVDILKRDLGKDRLGAIFEKANREVLERGITDGASTYVALLLDPKDRIIRISSMGDSRIYEIEEKDIRQLTEDDSPPDEPHVVTRGLGFAGMESSFFREEDRPLKEARFVLCSDGFYEFFEKEEGDVRRSLNFKRFGNMQNTFHRFVRGQNRDDATYIVVDVKNAS